MDDNKKRDKTEFDPIKVAMDGKMAEQVIWSTNSINAAIDGINKGLQLKANPFIGKDTQLLKPNLVYKRTKDEVEDFKRCMFDPIYFSSKCYIKTPTGMVPCVLRDYQIRYINHLVNNRFSILLAARQCGKSVTTAIFCLWTIIFRNDKMALLLSKSGAAGRDLLAKIKDMYRHLPFYLKPGVLKWNLSEIAFDNNSSMSTEAFSPTAGLGKTINFLVLDEFAWCPPNDVELFYNNIIPTITTDTNANICIISTQNGFNLFYKLFMGSVKGENIYANMTVNWWDVPNWDSKNNCWVKRDDKWRNEMVGVLGSEQNFEYQYGTQFLISDKCIVSREVMADIMENAKMFTPLEKHHVYKDELLYYSLNNKYFKIKEDYIFSKDKYYIILIDLAEGAGGDYTVFNIFEILGGEKFEQVAYWHSNKVAIEDAALEFWLMFGQVFDSERTLFSIEWNTYGELFWNYIRALNEPDDYNGAANWRFNVIKSLEGIETGSVIMYKKSNSNQMVPGLRWTHSSKRSACSLLRNKLSNKSIIINDLNTAVEIQNFEDKNSNGSYEAIYGHDDIVMTLTQIPEVEKTLRFRNLIETIQEEKVKLNLYNIDEQVSQIHSLY
jgi:hypothetical protein